MTEVKVNLNSEFDEYRDCLRLIWNYALRHRDKGTLSFASVSDTLLGALVLDDLANGTDANTSRVPVAEEGSCAYIPSLGVRVAVSRPLIMQEGFLGGREVEWKSIELNNSVTGLVFSYVDVFDFKSSDQMLDFEYVKAVPLRDFEQIKCGMPVLLRRSEVDIVDISNP